MARALPIDIVYLSVAVPAYRDGYSRPHVAAILAGRTPDRSILKAVQKL